MTYIEQAIRDAVRAGWKERHGDSHWSDTTNQKKVYRDTIFLDPLFWSALGKVWGWGLVNDCPRCRHYYPYADKVCRGDGTKFSEATLVKVSGDWKERWHRFIDHLIEGRDAESFFAEIYKT